MDSILRKAGEQGFRMPEIELPTFPDRIVSVADYGAVPDGAFLNTDAFARAIQACTEKGGGTVLIPSGLWLTGPIHLQSNMRLHLERGAVVLFTPEFEAYPLIRTASGGTDSVRCTSPVSGRGLENVAITGEGIFDGWGEAWRPVKRQKLTDSQWRSLVASGGVVDQARGIWWPSAEAMRGKELLEGLDEEAPLEAYRQAREYLRPVLVSLVACRRVLLDGPTFQNSPAWAIHPLLCEDVTVRNITVKNEWYAQNGDGLDLESCRNVYVHNCRFDVGDDAICLKSGKDEPGRRRGRPSENILITDCVVYHGHGGFVIGSEMSGGVRNVCVARCVFMGTDIGLRFKSTRGRGGVVEDIYIQDIDMVKIQTDAIRFNMYYGGRHDASGTSAVPEVTEETPVFRNIYLSDVLCRGARRAALLQGLPEMPIRNIQLRDASITADAGLTCVDAEEITLVNTQIVASEGAILSVRNGRRITISDLQPPEGAGVCLRLEGPRTTEIILHNFDASRCKKGIELGDEVSPGAVVWDA